MEACGLAVTCDIVHLFSPLFVALQQRLETAARYKFGVEPVCFELKHHPWKSDASYIGCAPNYRFATSY